MLGVIGPAPLDTEAALAAIAARRADAPFAYVVTANAQHLALLAEPAHPPRAAYEGAWLRLNDSQILARLSRLATGEGFPVATGSDLTRRLFEQGIAPDDVLLLVGGDAGLADALRAKYGLAALHLHVPPMGWASDPVAVRAALHFVSAHPARFVIVITGAPQSEMFLHRLAGTPGITGTGLAVGSALRFLVGQVRRAPVWMQRAGLEWLFRLLSEPRRLWRRYLIDSMPAIGIALRLWFRRITRG